MRTFVLFGLGMVVGAAATVAVGRSMQARQAQLPPPRPGEDNRPELQRIARNIMDACDDLNPALMELERSLNDRNLSPADIGRIVAQVRELTR